MKKLFPWIGAAALGAAAFFLFQDNRALRGDLAALREQNRDLPALRAENEELKKITVQTNELERLRKDNEEIHRLRNEVGQLRKEKQQLGQQIQAVQIRQPDLQKLQSENEQLRNVTQQFAAAQAQGQQNACIANLKQLEGAMEQWALENRKRIGAAVTTNDLIGPRGFIRIMPVCPAGGTYTLSLIGGQPACSIPGHAYALPVEVIAK